MANIPDNRFDDLRADHLAEEVREVADRNRRIAELQRQLRQAQERAEMQRQNLSYAAQYGALWRGKAEAAEALAEQRGKALLAIKRSVSKGEMRRIAIQAAPAEAQAQQKEER